MLGPGRSPPFPTRLLGVFSPPLPHDRFYRFDGDTVTREFDECDNFSLDSDDDYGRTVDHIALGS